ncbi:hypothetical protein SAMN05216420_101367 [Nitrosospira sp. Nl5]|uniref:hypothetical protein n=1 Tax=Nitrosospira sp. Nl5 TaxID=200120 RepID=UPI000881B96F|nr:hypothetical protein [Nitrosospira sp. Nl5]SCX93100.1 hypothetical protein SAMN05216420_101367 [Nitrosospira sp. Nl5]
METLADRLKKSLAKSGKKKTDIWKKCKVSSSAVTHWFNGSTQELLGEHLLCVARVLEVNPDWLATGEGDASLSATAKFKNQIVESLATMREDDVRHVAELCEKLTRKQGSARDERKHVSSHAPERRLGPNIPPDTYDTSLFEHGRTDETDRLQERKKR